MQIDKSLGISLAALHSQAVDYAKTGIAARMPKELRPPRWPHFMEKSHLGPNKTYTSRTILGKLYDLVEKIEFLPHLNSPFDKRIIDAFQLTPRMLEDAAEIKKDYDEHMLRIMAQYEIKTEFEIWSTFIMSSVKKGTDYKMHEEMGNLARALKDRFRKECIHKAGSRDFSVLAPFVAAMYKVTSNEMMEASSRQTHFHEFEGEVQKTKKESKEAPLISFPWLFHSELGRIATASGRSVALKGPPAKFTTPERVQKAKKKSSPQSGGINIISEVAALETETGEVKPGQVLDPFHEHDQKITEDKLQLQFAGEADLVEVFPSLIIPDDFDSKRGTREIPSVSVIENEDPMVSLIDHEILDKVPDVDEAEAFVSGHELMGHSDSGIALANKSIHNAVETPSTNSPIHTPQTDSDDEGQSPNKSGGQTADLRSLKNRQAWGSC
jgi:hypothetical protein